MKKTIKGKKIRKTVKKLKKKTVRAKKNYPVSAGETPAQPQPEDHRTKCYNCEHMNAPILEFCEKCGTRLGKAGFSKTAGRRKTEGGSEHASKDTSLIVGEVLKETFGVYSKIIWIVVAVAFMDALTAFFMPDFKDISSFKLHYIILILVSVVLTFLINFILLFVSHKTYYDEKYNVDSVLYTLEKKFGLFILNSVLFHLIVGLASLVIVPGIILSLMYTFVMYTTVVKSDVPSHFELSDKVTSGKKLDLLLFYLVLIVISIPFYGVSYGLQFLLQKVINLNLAAAVYAFLAALISSLSMPITVIIYKKLDGNRIEKEYTD